MSTPTKYSVIITNLVILVVFGFIFPPDLRHILIGYSLAMVAVMLIMLYSSRTVHYSPGLLWGLTVWSALHLAGTGMAINGERLYSLILIPLTADIFRYDQLIHIFGFGVATLFIYEISQRVIQKPIQNWLSFGIIIIAAGLGLGALNEIIEFLLSVFVPNVAIGDGLNTMLDLVADLIGSILAFIFIYFKHR